MSDIGHVPILTTTVSEVHSHENEKVIHNDDTNFKRSFDGANYDPNTLMAIEEYISKALGESQGLQEKFIIQPVTSSWTFTQGLLLGQISVILLLVAFIKFFVFSEPTADRKKLSPVSNPRRDKVMINLHKSQEGEESSTSTILEKTYYDVKNHEPESLDWFNVLVAQMMSSFRVEALNNDNIYNSLNKAFASSTMPDYLDKITINEINIGNDFPIFSNCRIKHSAGNADRLEAKIDVDVSDTFTLGIETKLLINHPKPFAASLPIKLSVSIVRFSGCLTVSLISTSDPEFKASLPGGNDSSRESNGNTTSDTNKKNEKDAKSEDSNQTSGAGLMFSFSPDFRLEFEITSLIGSRTKLENVPRVSSIIESVLRNWFVERCIEPRYQLIQLPSLWPRKKNTRDPVAASVSTSSAGNTSNTNGNINVASTPIAPTPSFGSTTSNLSVIDTYDE